ncbi:hypothetical protein SAMD00019534_122960 [Acytostelium subglobosum LB1]|uniref:hypothetical protein n=1 Tax=Acytostelium subglobosum LB1 TaxID=1410327 RepID=UPI000644F84D|nr:hypothetical protein SAMD00019534_122960 [Acytostelium subglobosum LB1]GAM29120.1 hypothetical protein SAMD00019534_122960 [Acytostelium subglobosum LB1]|eukprot:XP_012747965.1 hypothetical protein SAMD00019534_122960 [Acytostelium subglobosum LB1]
MADEVVEFDSSKLGTKEHWEECYDREINCFDESGDVGEIWFGKACLKKMCKEIAALGDVSKDAAVLDIGCGNGYTLVELHRLGFTNLHGSDYSPKAIDLATRIAQSENIPSDNIHYFVDDIRSSTVLDHTYDIIVDKGTFDAMALSDDKEQAREDYRRTVIRTIKAGGYFVITSCNFTQAELQTYFGGVGMFIFLHTVQYPVMRFGGSQGQSQTTCVFRVPAADSGTSSSTCH